jgi:hypothetical protein
LTYCKEPEEEEKRGKKREGSSAGEREECNEASDDATAKLC